MTRLLWQRVSISGYTGVVQRADNRKPTASVLYTLLATGLLSVSYSLFLIPIMS
jgi:hypothetical protein